VDFRLLPESVNLPGTSGNEGETGDAEARLISNVRTAEQYEFASQDGVRLSMSSALSPISPS
jgi:hypothetical protein